MNELEMTEKIFQLKQENEKRYIEYERKKFMHEQQERLLECGVFIIAEQMRINNMLALSLLIKEGN